VIQDIELAPRNAHGMVEYTTLVSILKPVNMSSSNGAMLFEIVNRGNKLDPGFFNVGVNNQDPVGDGFLQKQGFTLVWAGWQADLTPQPGLITMSAPVAPTTITDASSRDASGPSSSSGSPPGSRNRLSWHATDSCRFELHNTAGYATVNVDNSHDTLTMRVHPKRPSDLSSRTTCGRTRTAPARRHFQVYRIRRRCA